MFSIEMRVVAVPPSGEISEVDIDVDTLRDYNTLYLEVESLQEPNIVAWIPDEHMGTINEVANLMITGGRLDISGTVYLGTYDHDSFDSISPETVLNLYALRKYGECNRGICNIL